MSAARRDDLNGADCPAESLTALAQALSPIVAVRVGLRFSRDSAPGLFHQPALTAMLRTLSQGELASEPLFWVSATEGGRASYRRGEQYRFDVYAARTAHSKLMRLIVRRPRIGRHLPDEARVPFGGNLVFEGLYQPINEEPLRPARPVVVFDPAHLEAERERFLSSDRIRVRLLSPLRVLRDKTERGEAKGDARYVHDAAQLGPLFFRRVHDALLAVAKSAEVWLPRQADEPQPLDADLFHIDWEYRDAKGRGQHMAGMLGWLDFATEDLKGGKLDALLLAQRLGIGQRRRFGWGALRLETASGQGVVPPRRSVRHLLARSAGHENLRQAFRDSANGGDTPRQWQRLPRRTLPADALYWLDQVHERLLSNDYAPPPLNGRVLLPKDGRVRPLAVPPWEDRFVQRAVARVLNAELETLFNPTSFGYRRGRSRHQIRDQIGTLYRQGYRYYLEADISGFFDHVQHSRIETRLRGLLGDDPVIEPILRWLAAPVEFEGHRVERVRGLPQGSPLSPTLANMFLEDLDADCQAHGMKLLRYADDFVVLCRDENEAQAALERAETSIDELGLRLKPAKTGIGRLDEGASMEFLGFRFIGDLSIKRTKPTARAGRDIHIPKRSWLAELVEHHPEIRERLQNDWRRRHHGSGRARSRADPARREGAGGHSATRPGQGGAPASGTAKLAGSNEPGEAAKQGMPNTGQQAESVPDAAAAPGPSSDGIPSPAAAPEEPPSPATHYAEGSLLCITEPALLAQRQGQLVVLTDQEGGQQHPWSELEAVLVFGLARITTGAIGAALQHGVAIHFLGGAEGYRGRLVAEHHAIDDLDAALAQRERFADPALQLMLARRLVAARLHNQREVLRQRLRGAGRAASVLDKLAELAGRVEQAESTAALNGLEGSAARIYFGALAPTLPDWAGFEKRNRRPPRDPFNALLSLGFTIMYSRTVGLAQAMGFHPRIGFYHQPHGRHAVLASDLMEPFRHLVERTACTVLARRELKTDDFSTDEERGCRLEPAALKRYLQRLAESLARSVTATSGESGNFYLHMQRQLRSLDRLRRGEGDFRPWFYRIR
jgi:group II intron reverse transcriptase/maturase/CRISPR-associated endonuclease Cas1